MIDIIFPCITFGIIGLTLLTCICYVTYEYTLYWWENSVRYRSYNKTIKKIQNYVINLPEWERIPINFGYELRHYPTGLRIAYPTSDSCNRLNSRFICLCINGNYNYNIKCHYRPHRQTKRAKDQWYLLFKNIIDNPENYVKQLKIYQYNKDVKHLLNNI